MDVTAAPQASAPLAARAGLRDLIAGFATHTPLNTAIAAPGRAPLTYQQLAAQLEHAAGQLDALGIGRGDRVAILLPNGPEMAVAFLAVASVASSAPLNPAHNERELDFYLSDLQAKALITTGDADSCARRAARRLGLPVVELTVERSAPAGNL